jgi:catechol 2,3-dioxygenase-like lactoylglutathione lyase family enzyme
MFALDHIVILVRDLATAIDDYTALGFTVVPGGEHQGGASHNALIAFADDSYLELLAFQRPPLPTEQPSPLERRFRQRQAAGEGLVDFALLPEDIQGTIATAAGRGLALEGPFPGSRVRPDGQRVAWQLGIPQAPALPFLCADVTPRALRVPQGEARRHANGVTGVAGLAVAVSDLGRYVEGYRSLLGVEPRPGPALPVPDAQGAHFMLPSAVIALVTPASGGSPLHNHLAQRGEGPFALWLHARDVARSGRLDPARSHGAWIEMVADDPSTAHLSAGWR